MGCFVVVGAEPGGLESREGARIVFERETRKSNGRTFNTAISQKSRLA
jgi:hypothetical protein